MGKKMDAFLGRRSFKTAKFKATANLAISRLAVLKNQRQARCNIARSDVVQLLNLGEHERALLRVEHVIKEQNMLDVFVTLEGYCYLLTERANQLEHEKDCPEELKEAISSLIFGATRCGEFPELQELRDIFSSKFGKEFTSRAAQLRNNCGVNPKMIQKLSTRMPSYENRLKVLKDIAKENDIVLHVEEETTQQANTKEEKVVDDHIPVLDQEVEIEVKGKYKDVAAAAQAAFESAAYAAAAARAAVELSRSESGGSDHHSHPYTPKSQTLKASETINHNENIKNTEDEILDEEILPEKINNVDDDDNKIIGNVKEHKSPISVRTKSKYHWSSR